MTKSKTLIVIVLLTVTIIAFGALIWKARVRPSDTSPNSITVVTTLFPLYDFTNQIGGEMVNVTLLLPPGMEAHSYEPTPGDLALINSTDVFIYTGPFMEPWAEDIVDSVGGRVAIVNAGEGSSPVAFDSNEDKHEESSGSHEPDGVDPHIWLDFDNAAIMARNIEHTLSTVDPDHAVTYRSNLDSYLKQLNTLDSEYRSVLATCSTRTIVFGGHYAFGYMAGRYGLRYEAAQGFSPDAEPSASDLISIIDDIRQQGLKYVFTEKLDSPDFAETLARETGTQLLPLSSAHNVSRADIDAGITYIRLMRDNLDNLTIGLSCTR